MFGLLSLMVLFNPGILISQVETTNLNIADWEAYKTLVDNKETYITIDLALSKTAPNKNQRFIAWISVKLIETIKDGKLTENEEVWMENIQRGLIINISANYNSTFIGHQTYNGYREFYFYVNDTLGLNMVFSETMNFFNSYQSKFGFRKDELWAGYFDYLYPDPESLRRIYNRKIIRNLEVQGDKLEKERLVYHWIYFKTINDRNKFIVQVRDRHFKIEDEAYDPTLGNWPYLLHLSRIDKVDYQSVDSYVMPLWKAVKELHGKYNNWETIIIKD